MPQRLARLLAITSFAIVTPSAVSFAATGPGPQPNATTIHVLGSFNDWDTSLWFSDPGMTKDGPLWRDSVAIAPYFVGQGYQQFKLVTDRAWDFPPDYVLCPGRLDEYGLLGGPVCLTSGGLNLQMYADAPGSYEITLDEVALRYDARLIETFTATMVGRVVETGSQAPLAATVEAKPANGTLTLARTTSHGASGNFTLARLDGGTYDLGVTAPGYQSAQVTGVTISDGGFVDVGTVALTPAACTSSFFAIQVVGDFNGWNTATPSMTQVSGCVWEDTLTVTAGCTYLKFRTNNDWGNDYGTCTAEDPTCNVPPSGQTCLVSGGSALGKISFPSTGDYLFRLDEGAGTYQITLQGPTPTAVKRISWGQLKSRYRSTETEP